MGYKCREGFSSFQKILRCLGENHLKKKNHTAAAPATHSIKMNRPASAIIHPLVDSGSMTEVFRGEDTATGLERGGVSKPKVDATFGV